MQGGEEIGGHIPETGVSSLPIGDEHTKLLPRAVRSRTALWNHNLSIPGQSSPEYCSLLYSCAHPTLNSFTGQLFLLPETITQTLRKGKEKDASFTRARADCGACSAGLVCWKPGGNQAGHTSGKWGKLWVLPTHPHCPQRAKFHQPQPHPGAALMPSPVHSQVWVQFLLNRSVWGCFLQAIYQFQLDFPASIAQSITACSGLWWMAASLSLHHGAWRRGCSLSSYAVSLQPLGWSWLEFH